MKTLLIGINAKYIHSNLAIRYLKAYALSKGEFDIQLAEFTINQQLDLILREILKIKPSIIGFSCYIWNFDYIQKLVVTLKKLLPNVIIFLGGPEVSFNALEVITQTSCDAVICGEGEQAFFELLTSIQRGEPISEIIECSKSVSLDDIPFVYTNYDDLQNRIVYYEASRGCPFNCQYCLSGSEGSVRVLSHERVFSDLEKFLKAEIPQVKFIDRTFNANRSYAMDIWRFLSSNDNGITNFHFEIAAELLTDEMIEFLQTTRQGLFQFEIGVQSTNPPTLLAIKRNTDTELLTKIVTALQKNHNIHLHLDLIAGLPYENNNEFSNSFNFVYDLNPDQLQLGFLKLLKGSGLFSKREEYGLVHTSFPPYEILQSNSLSYSEIIDLKQLEELVEIYYNSNRYKLSIKFLSGLFATPFEFFFRLSHFYQQNQHHLRPHSKVEYYDILLDFLLYHCSDCVKFNQLVVAITYDIYSHEKAKKLPLRLGSGSKNGIYEFFDNRDNVERYLPEYIEFDTKQIMRNAHIEVFPYNPITGCGSETALLFNYRRCDNLGNATVTEILIDNQ